MTEIARPGNTASQGAFRMYCDAPSVSIPPQVGTSRRHSDAQEAERRLDDNRQPQCDGAQHDVARRHVGQDMSQHDAPRPRADGLRRQACSPVP